MMGSQLGGRELGADQVLIYFPKLCINRVEALADDSVDFRPPQLARALVAVVARDQWIFTLLERTHRDGVDLSALAHRSRQLFDFNWSEHPHPIGDGDAG